MSAGMISDGSQVQQVLEACRRHVRLHVVMSGLAGIVTVGLVCLLTAAVLDFLFDVPPTGRILLLAIGLLAVGHSCWTLLIRPLMTRLSDSEMGAAVDLAFPDLRERLATLVSIQRPEASGSETGSALMQQHLRDEVRDHLRQVEVQQVVDAHQTIRRCGGATGILLLSLLPVLLWPSGSRLLLQRLMNPFANLASATNLYFDIEDANRTVARGSTVRIAAAPRWRTATSGERPDQVQLQLVAEGGHTETLAMSFDEVSGCFIGEISRIAQSVQYQVSGGGARSELCRITVVDAPEIRSATMTVTPPVYTGRVVERIDGMIGEMEVFENSRMEIVLEFNKPVQSAEFVWVRRDQRPLTETELFDRRFDNITGEELVEEDPMAELVPVTEPLADRIAGEVSSDGTSALFHLTADVGGEFEFQIQDEHELPNAVEPERRIQVIYDQRPKLVVSGAADGDQFRPNDILPLNCLATDDIGIGLLELHYRRNDDVDLIEAAVSFDRGAAEVRHAFRLDLKDMQLSSGDRLTLQVRTADERPDPGPQEVWSEPIQIVIDENARAAGAKALEEETQAMLDSLKALEAQLRKDSENARELKNSTHADWNQEKREQTQRLSEKEQQQGRFLEELATEVATHPLMKDSAEQLQQLSGEVRDEVSAELQQAVTEDRREAGEHLHQSSEQLKQSADRLQQEIEKIEEAARLEQDLAELNRLALEAEQLARESRELDDDRRDPTRRPEETSEQQWQDQLNQRQQELAQEQQELAQDLEQLLRDQNELLDAAQRSQQEQLQELAREVEELARDQRRLAQGIQEEAQEVTRDARQVADKLQQVRRDAERFNRDVEQNAPDASRADLAALDEAVQQLRQGNLATPQNNVSQVADELNESRQQLQQPPSDNDADDPVPADAETSDAGKTKPAAEDKVAAGESASDSEKLPQNLPSINSPDGTPPGDGKPGEVAPADAAPGDAKPAEVAQQDSNGDPKAQPASAKPSPSDSEPTSKGEPAANGESTTKGEPAAAAQANSDSPPSTADQAPSEGQASPSSEPDLKGKPASNAAAMTPEQHAARQQAADQAAELSKRLNDIEQEIQQLRSERNAASAQADDAEPSEDAANATEPADQNAADSPAAASALTEPSASANSPTAASQPNPNEPAAADQNAGQAQNATPGDIAASNRQAARDLMEQMTQLTDAARQAAEQLQNNPTASNAARQAADEAVQRAESAEDEAAAGRFQPSSDQLRQASQRASQSAGQLNQPGQNDQQQTMQSLASEMQRMSDNVRNMQRDNGTQAAAQQQTQQQLTQQTSQLPDRLADLAQRLNLPALGMQQQAQQSESATQTAQQAQSSSQQANDQLQQGNLRQAEQSGQQTAQQLDQVAGMARQAGQSPASEPSPIPSEVGNDVVDALQNLQHAQQAMQMAQQQNQSGTQQGDQNSEQPNGAASEQGQNTAANGQQPGQQGQPGQQSQQGQQQSGQPGQESSQEGQPSGEQNGQPSGSQPLSNAAQALAQAAQNALPQQFNPGQMSDGNQSTAAGRDAMGNAAMWDGLLPNATAGRNPGSRNWGQSNEELDTETSESAGVSRDSEYQSLIRMYFRELAKAASQQ